MSELSKEDFAKLVQQSEELKNQQRPDEILLSRAIVMLEDNIGEVNFEDVIQREGNEIVVDGKNVELYELEANIKIFDKDRQTNEDGSPDLDHMFETYFEPVAKGFRDMMEQAGYNVCRPIGIQDNDLTVREGILQLCLAGDKISLYMCHKYHAASDPYTDLYFRILVGKR